MDASLFNVTTLIFFILFLSNYKNVIATFRQKDHHLCFYDKVMKSDHTLLDTMDFLGAVYTYFEFHIAKIKKKKYLGS